MSTSNSALAHLTATYTDSENEDEFNKLDDSLDSSSDSQVIIPPQKLKITVPVESPDKLAQKRRLVSYHDETMISDDEVEENRVHKIVKPTVITKEIQLESDDGSEFSSQNNKTSTTDNIEKTKFAHYGFSLPPEVKGKPNPELVDKIKNFYDKMKTNNVDMNKIIQERKEFRNPSIYEKLIQFCDINEFGTNYPPEIYDPLQWGSESYYEELAETQKKDMLKRQKERKDLAKVEQATAAARKVEEDAKKRKSKWDQPALPATALTTQVTGTKGTVLSAFGSLPKKTG